MANLAQSIPSGISTEWLIYAVVIVIWAGSWLATQVTAHRRKAAKKAAQSRNEPKAMRTNEDAFTRELSRTAPRELRAERKTSPTPKREMAKDPISPALEARVGTPSSSVTPSTGSAAPPDLGKLFRDPKAFLEQVQQYAESQQGSAATTKSSAKPGGTGNTPARSGGASTSSSPMASDRGLPRRTPPARATLRPVAKPAASAIPSRPQAIGSAKRDTQVSVANVSSTKRRLGLLDADDLRRAILLSEIIQPPVALRREHLNDPSK